MWEDDVLCSGERAGWTDSWYEKSKWLIDQLVYSRDHRPYLTHYIASVEKKDWHRRRPPLVRLADAEAKPPSK